MDSSGAKIGTMYESDLTKFMRKFLEDLLNK